MGKLLLLNFVIPVVMLLVSAFLKYGSHPYPGPPSYGQTKWKVDFSGYNTPRSRQSQNHWELAQQLAPGAFFRNGLYALILAVVCCAVSLLWEPARQVPLWFVSFVFMGRAFRQVEKALEDRFG